MWHLNDVILLRQITAYALEFFNGHSAAIMSALVSADLHRLNFKTVAGNFQDAREIKLLHLESKSNQRGKTFKNGFD